jgi:hypothetical protein
MHRGFFFMATDEQGAMLFHGGGLGERGSGVEFGLSKACELFIGVRDRLEFGGGDDVLEAIEAPAG